MAWTFKSSYGSENEMGERVQFCKLEQCNLIGWSSIYGGDFTHKNGQLQIKSIQPKEQEQTLNSIYLGSFILQEF